jgi:hypothetical protein
MPSGPDVHEIEGVVQRIHLSGLGPNSGELTVAIAPPGKQPMNVYAGIMDDRHSMDPIEHGVFAGYVSIASLAHETGATVRCTYLKRHKERINGLTISSP